VHAAQLELHAAIAGQAESRAQQVAARLAHVAVSPRDAAEFEPGLEDTVRLTARVGHFDRVAQERHPELCERSRELAQDAEGLLGVAACGRRFDAGPGSFEHQLALGIPNRDCRLERAVDELLGRIGAKLALRVGRQKLTETGQRVLGEESAVQGCLVLGEDRLGDGFDQEPVAAALERDAELAQQSAPERHLDSLGHLVGEEDSHPMQRDRAGLGASHGTGLGGRARSQ
jgi:hypothetical protein